MKIHKVDCTDERLASLKRKAKGSPVRVVGKDIELASAEAEAFVAQQEKDAAEAVTPSRPVAVKDVLAVLLEKGVLTQRDVDALKGGQ